MSIEYKPGTCWPVGCVLLRYPSTVAVERDGKLLATLAIPYEHQSVEQWRERITEALEKAESELTKARQAINPNAGTVQAFPGGRWSGKGAQ